ncbi:hypothetical protein BH23VER1_BH23VER1_36620 [soil metagenome]
MHEHPSGSSDHPSNLPLDQGGFNRGRRSGMEREPIPARITEVTYPAPRPSGGGHGGGHGGPPGVDVGGPSVSDFAHALFRHRWMIILCGLAGLGAAATFYFTTGSSGYQSHAKVLIHYVIDRSEIDQVDSRLATSGPYNGAVMDAELQIISSWDLARNAARIIGPERILPNFDSTDTSVVASIEDAPAEDATDSAAPGTGTAPATAADPAATVADAPAAETPAAEAEDPDERRKADHLAAAAAAISQGMDVVSKSNSNVIQISYRNQDPRLAVQILDELIEQYNRKHREIRRPLTAIGKIAEEREAALAELRDAESAEKRSRQAARAIWPNGTMESIEAELASVKASLGAAETDYSEQLARLAAIDANAADIAQASSEEEEAAEPVVEVRPPAATVQEYERLLAVLNALNARQGQLLIDMTPQSSLVRSNEAKLADAEARRLAMVEEFPSLAATSAASGGGSRSTAGLDPFTERARLAAIDARRRNLGEQLVDLTRRANDLSQVAIEVAELELKREIKQENYRILEKSYQQTLVDQKMLDPSHMPNISVIEEPGVARVAPDGTKRKILLGLAGGGFLLGIGLALLMELFLDRTVKRPRDIDTKLGLPLLMTIPWSGGKRSRLADRKAGRAARNRDEKDGALAAVGKAPWDEQHFIRPYAEAIRDRLEYYFELKRMTHNPKLIGVTGLSKNAGASTIAAGLATAFSDTGEGKVLLMDLNPEHAGVHPFFEGKPVCSVTEALKSGSDVNARFKAADKYLFLATVSGNLNHPPNGQRHRPGDPSDPGAPDNTDNTNGTHNTDGTNGTSDSRPGARFIPKQIYDLMPQFKISDFDYIIFELPPLGETSPTVAMAGFMDKLLVVAESGETNAAELKRQVLDLTRGRADVTCLLNKVDTSAPKWLPS